MSHPDPGSQEREALLKAEIARLREHTARATDFAHEPVPTATRPSRAILWLLALAAIVILAAAFLGGYLPRARQDATVVAETRRDAGAPPQVSATQVLRPPARFNLDLPGSIQALTEAPILARADGYLKRRLVDIGDRVQAGQLLAEIEAPELEQQLAQARATLQQSIAAQEQAAASLDQARANEQLARVTAQRWANLLARGAVSQQDHDVYQAQARALEANVQAQQKNVAAAAANVAAARSNAARLEQLLAYLHVRAPFSGIVTLRNVDTGALISAGQTLLFRIAQPSTLRTFVNVPQGYASALRPGLPATVTFAGLPGRAFQGRVAHTSSALDQNTRTLLVEIQLPNAGGLLMPGMYCQVSLEIQRSGQPLIIPGDTLMLRPQGPLVAIVRDDNTIHLQTIRLGRDFGKELEVLDGLQPGQWLVVNPGDDAREGARVRPIRLKSEPPASAAPVK
jgi:RND family efflux transporter MFP subunit